MAGWVCRPSEGREDEVRGRGAHGEARPEPAVDDGARSGMTSTVLVGTGKFCECRALLSEMNEPVLSEGSGR